MPLFSSEPAVYADSVKLVIAYVQEARLEPVIEALTEAGIASMSVSNARGCGAQRGYEEQYRGAVTVVKLLHKIRLEVAVPDAQEQAAIDAIVAGGQTGQIGAGKLFVLNLARTIRVRTGEEGDEALA